MTSLRRFLPKLLLATALAGCSSAAPSVSPSPSPTASPPALPAPTCGGLKIAIPNALPCDQLVTIAISTLAEHAPQQLARGVTSIDVFLSQCPRGEVPPQVDCATENFAQLVTIRFGPAGAGGPIEESLTVAIGPVTGRVLGIVNPLIR